jgi:hypothetical protein
MPTSSTLPAGIEIFRAGRHTDDTGTAREFTDADIDAIAAAYAPATREAPLVVGHPALDAPAYGWVGALRSLPHPDGHRLVIDSRDVEPRFAELVASRRFPKRSAAFYPPQHPNNPAPGAWYLRHVGFLGAQPPAIAGLKDVQFAQNDAAGLVCFSETTLPADRQGHALSHPTLISLETPMDDTVLKETAAKLAAQEAKFAEAEAARQAADAENAALKTQLAQFAEAQKTERHARHAAFAAAQAAAGKLLPKDQAAAVAVLDTLADAAVVEFAEGETTRKISPVEFVKTLIEAGGPKIQFGEFAPGHAGQKPVRDMSDAELDAAAKRYALEKSVSYGEALSRVVAFTQ